MASEQPTASWRHELFLLRRAARSWPYWSRLPRVSVEQAFPGISRLEVSVSHSYSPRGLPHGDAYVLSLITAHVRPRRVFESARPGRRAPS